MAKTNGSVELTIGELKAMLAGRETEIAKLQTQRRIILDQVAEIDAEIAKVNGGKPSGGKHRGRPVGSKNAKKVALKADAPKPVAKPAKKGKRGRPAGSKNKPKTAAPVAAAPAGEMSLREAIGTVLSTHKDGMRARDIKAEVEKIYDSKAQDFYAIVAATLRDKSTFKKVSRGVYRNKKEVATA